MIRTIIKIDENKCNGCSLCVNASHEGALKMIDGKAKLIRDDYCDGLGHCLPSCPTGAISFEEREALPYDDDAVQQAKQIHNQDTPKFSCPGSQAKKINKSADLNSVENSINCKDFSQLNQWPVQIKLVPPNAPYFNNANLLIAADCTAYAYGNFHNKFMKNKITLIGCPKLDEGDYAEKLTAILSYNNIKSVTVVRMSVPCCGGIVNAVTTAMKNSEKIIPWQVVTITPDGDILD